jgi:hypothetical protein
LAKLLAEEGRIEEANTSLRAAASAGKQAASELGVD